MSNDQILRGYALISSLKSNVPDNYEVPERWVHEFHTALEKLEKATGIDLGDFKVASTEIKRSVGSRNMRSGEVSYRDGLWCKRDILMHKIDAVLTYFTGLGSDKSKTIGFQTP